MSTEYSSNIPYNDFIKTNIFKISEPKIPIYILEHKVIEYNGNKIPVFKGDGFFKRTKDNAIFERFGFNNPTEIFILILKKFPNSQIIDLSCDMPWLEYEGY